MRSRKAALRAEIGLFTAALLLFCLCGAALLYRQVLEENKDLLQKSGFVLERFGNHSMVVREIPSFFATGCDVVSVVQQICTNLQKGSREIEASQLDWLFNNTACRAAIKAGNYSTTQSLQQLIQDIYRYNIARYCPHGRPIMIQITKNELEKRFGRE